MPVTQNNGAGLHWQAQGPLAAPAIVLLHSIGTDLSIYEGVVPLLAAQFRVIAMDLRGHGASEASDAEYSPALLSSDVLAVMDEAGIDRAVICGTSLGGMVAMELVNSAPDRVSGLVLANTSAAMSPALWPERIRTAREQGLAPILAGWAGRHLSEAWMAAHPERVAELERVFMATDPRGYIGCAAAIRDLDVLPSLPEVAVPTLIIAGEQDIATPFSGHGDRIAAAITGAKVEFLPAGHLACLEQPAKFAGSVAGLARLCA